MRSRLELMKKEALFAIIIGVLVGLGVTYGMYSVRQRFFTPTDPMTLDTEAQPSPSPIASGEQLAILTPEDEAVLASTDLTLSGTTQPNHLVTVFVNQKEYVTQADEIGAFAVKVELDLGGNVITVTSINTDGSQVKKEISVIVSTVDLNGSSTASQSSEPTASATPRP